MLAMSGFLPLPCKRQAGGRQRTFVADNRQVLGAAPAPHRRRRPRRQEHAPSSPAAPQGPAAVELPDPRPRPAGARDTAFAVLAAAAATREKKGESNLKYRRAKGQESSSVLGGTPVADLSPLTRSLRDSRGRGVTARARRPSQSGARSGPPHPLRTGPHSPAGTDTGVPATGF